MYSLESVQYLYLVFELGFVIMCTYGSGPKSFNASIYLSQLFVTLDNPFQQTLLTKSTGIESKSICMEASPSS